jgi:hypothetical protein
VLSPFPLQSLLSELCPESLAHLFRGGSLESIMKTFIIALVLAIVGITGCGSRSTSSSQQKALYPRATVVFIGDSITYNWGQPWASPDFTQHPTWIDARAWLGMTPVRWLTASRPT